MKKTIDERVLQFTEAMNTSEVVVRHELEKFLAEFIAAGTEDIGFSPSNDELPSIQAVIADFIGYRVGVRLAELPEEVAQAFLDAIKAGMVNSSFIDATGCRPPDTAGKLPN